MTETAGQPSPAEAKRGRHAAHLRSASRALESADGGRVLKAQRPPTSSAAADQGCEFLVLKTARAKRRQTARQASDSPRAKNESVRLWGVLNALRACER